MSCSTLARSTLHFLGLVCASHRRLERLGCKRNEKGGIISDPITEESSVPGVYVAGDASRDVLLIAVAIADGAKAAVAINRALLEEEGTSG